MRHATRSLASKWPVGYGDERERNSGGFTAINSDAISVRQQLPAYVTGGREWSAAAAARPQVFYVRPKLYTPAVTLSRSHRHRCLDVQSTPTAVS